MSQIQMVDLKGQYEKIKDEMDAAILDVVRSSAYINGPAVKAFQANLEEVSQRQTCHSVCEWNRRSADFSDGTRTETGR